MPFTVYLSSSKIANSHTWSQCHLIRSVFSLVIAYHVNARDFVFISRNCVLCIFFFPHMYIYYIYIYINTGMFSDHVTTCTCTAVCIAFLSCEKKQHGQTAWAGLCHRSEVSS